MFFTMFQRCKSIIKWTDFFSVSLILVIPFKINTPIIILWSFVSQLTPFLRLLIHNLLFLYQSFPWEFSYWVFLDCHHHYWSLHLARMSCPNYLQQNFLSCLWNLSNPRVRTVVSFCFSPIISLSISMWPKNPNGTGQI